MPIEYEKNNKERIPYEHYLSQLAPMDPKEISARTNIPYDENSKQFHIRLMGTSYTIDFPSFNMQSADGTPYEAFNGKILLARYLAEGKYVPSRGEQMTYREVPWGEVYFQNFQGRCLMRLAFTFGNKLDAFEKAMNAVGGQPINMGDKGYRFEFINGLYVYFILWAGDEEFPPSSQILFEDNFPTAFTAEDMAVVGDISIGTLKQLSK